MRLVIGLGNELLRDEGVGVHACRALQARALPPDSAVLEVGCAVLDALPALQQAEALIVIDAVKMGVEPGTVIKSRLGSCECNAQIGSMHGFDLRRVLALAGREDIPDVVVLGVETAEIDWGLELSSPVAAALPHVIEEVERLLAVSQE